MNLFPYTSAIALSWAFEVDLSPAFILNLMQFSMHPSVEMMPCQIAFLFSDLVFIDLNSMQAHRNHLHSFHSLQTLLLIF